MVAMQSQQAWIISALLGSPLVQVTTTPFLVMSHLHMPMEKLQQQTVIPFIIMQQLHRPPCSMLHRLCIMLAANGSSVEQVIFMPPLTRSILTVQRGTIIMPVPEGMVAGMPMLGMAVPCMPIPGIPTPVRSIIIMFIMPLLLTRGPSSPLPLSRHDWRAFPVPRAAGTADSPTAPADGCLFYPVY